MTIAHNGTLAEDSGSLALLTDLYQLTMAYGYFRAGVGEREVVFHYYFRSPPFGGEFAVSCGLDSAIEYLQGTRFMADDLRYLATLRGNDDGRLFDDDFLAFLGEMKFSCDVDSVPEGTVVFANEPLLRIRGSVIQCQILETPLLNLFNFPTLIASKAARICTAARGEPVLEFGLRRAQGMDGGLTAARAAYVGGAAATSNVLAGKRFGIPVRGTHAHSWIMFFEDELEAFRTYADAMPNNCIFLVDTYDSMQGVERAIEVGHHLRKEGYEMAGIRLDSGDLCSLSIAARKLLDDAGFERAAIVASNELDEYSIEQLKSGGSPIAVWGVGTRLATAYEQPALGGVYKLAAVRDDSGAWQRRIKLSEEAAKTTNPGLLQIRRYQRAGSFVADLVYDIEYGIGDSRTMVDVSDHDRIHELAEDASGEDLLVPIFRRGQLVYDRPQISVIRDRTLAQLAALPAAHQHLYQAQSYPVGLERAVWQRKMELTAKAQADHHANVSDMDGRSPENE